MKTIYICKCGRQSNAPPVTWDCPKPQEIRFITDDLIYLKAICPKCKER